MLNTLLILMILAALLLVVVILIQNPKGGGIASEFGGATTQMFGVQKTGDILEQLTWGFFTFIVVGALITGVFFGGVSENTGSSELDVETVQTAPAGTPAPSLPQQAPAQNQPAGPAPAK